MTVRRLNLVLFDSNTYFMAVGLFGPDLAISTEGIFPIWV